MERVKLEAHDQEQKRWARYTTTAGLATEGGGQQTGIFRARVFCLDQHLSSVFFCQIAKFATDVPFKFQRHNSRIVKVMLC